MKDTKAKKPKLTDAERHKRFIETAKKVGASDSIDEFDSAFMQVLTHRQKTAGASEKGPKPK